MARCVKCSQEIPDGAAFCSACGTSQQRKKGMGTGAKIAIGVGGGLLFILVCSGIVANRAQPGASSQAQAATGSSATPTRAEVAEVVDAVNVTARELVSAYESNEIAADSSYKGQLVSVSGAVGDIGKDILGAPYVTLQGPSSSIRTVQCMFERKAEAELASLRSGQKLVLVGRVDGLMMNVLVRDCRISPPKAKK